jgi:putative MFS transporter
MNSTGIRFSHPVAFAVGVCLLAAGVLMHVPDFLAMDGMGYRMVGMPMSMLMLTGMACIVVGLALATYGLVPSLAVLRGTSRAASSRYYARAMDEAPVTAAHWWLLFVLGVALVIDVMKPATLGFVLPGLRNEYGISTAQAATLPFVALTGTTIGSIVWGLLADRLGRRASILLAAMFFLGTSICGFMPAFSWNLVMCFLMGLSAGGMLPIVYALMAEAVPARVRGWLVILHGGLGTACGYLAASGLASTLEPLYGWRILWFVGLPTGLLIVVLNRWIPESPRFLLEHGQDEAARVVMQRFGVRLDTLADAPAPQVGQVPAKRPGLAALFREGRARHSVAIVLYGLAWGLVNWGFVTFLPTILADAGLKANASTLLFYGALASIPGTVVTAYLYGKWSSRKSMIAFALLTAASLGAFAAVGQNLAQVGSSTIVGLTALLMLSSTAVVSMLSPYAAEVYPTDLRGAGSGLAAAASKFGGLVGPPLIGPLVGAGVLMPALVAAAPIAVAGLAMAVLGVETRGRSLEGLTAPLREGEGRERAGREDALRESAD